MPNVHAEQSRFAKRAGSDALLVFTRVLTAQILKEHRDGLLEPGELESRLGWAAKASLRVATERLRKIGVLVQLKGGELHTGSPTDLTAAGRDLLGLSDLLETWLLAGPLGPAPLPDVAARGAIKSLVGGWDSTIVMELAGGSQTLAELSDAIPGISYPILKRRLTSLRSVGLIVSNADGKDRRSQKHSVSMWLRAAIGPVSVACRWEGIHVAATTERMTWEDIEAVFLLALPLIQLPRDVRGECVLAAPAPPQSDEPQLAPAVAAVSVVVEKGRVVSCIPGMPAQLNGWALGTPRAWLETMVSGGIDRLRIRGATTGFTREVAAGMNRALFPQ